MATAEDFIAECRRYLGTTEAPPGSNRQPFADRAGHLNGYAWCASYIVACARAVGLKLPSESAWTPSMADGFRRAGRWYAKPERGDIGFIDFPGDNTTGIQHVVVIQQPGGILHKTIEGNTSSPYNLAGSQDNGGGVYERTRQASLFVGFGRPDYSGTKPTLGQGDLPTEEELVRATVVPRQQGGYIVVQNDGGVFAYDGAPYKGSIPSLKPAAKLGGNVIGGAWTASGDGYWLLAADGAVYGFGDARYYGGFNAEKPETRGGRYAVGLVRTAPNAYRIVTFDPSGDASRFDSYDYREKV
jgi:hypothetical protein